MAQLRILEQLVAFPKRKNISHEFGLGDLYRFCYQCVVLPPLPFPPCYNIYWRVVLVWLFPRWYWTHCSLIAWTGSSGKTLAQHFLRTTTILPLLNLKDITYCVQSFPSDVVLAALSLCTKIKPKFCLLLLSSVALGLLCSTYSFDRNSITIIWLGCGALVS